MQTVRQYMGQGKKAEKGLPFFFMYLHKLEKKKISVPPASFVFSCTVSRGYRSAEKMPPVQNHMA